MNLWAFNSFILFLLLLFMQVFHSYRNHYNDEKILRRQVGQLQSQLAERHMQTTLLQYQMREFQQQVASLMPAAIEQQAYSYPLRNLASIVDDPEPISLEQASELYAKAEALYREKHYEEAALELKKIKNFYPDSVHLPEAVFLLTECQYQMALYEESIDSIQLLLEQFAEHVLTGYALLRLGRIYEKHERSEDAIMAYKMVAERFPQAELKQQARQLLEGLR